jgi:hypothetical protein
VLIVAVDVMLAAPPAMVVPPVVVLGEAEFEFAPLVTVVTPDPVIITTVTADPDTTVVLAGIETQELVAQP